MSTHYFSSCPLFISIKISLLCLQIKTSWNSDFNRQSIKYSVISYYQYWQLVFPIDSTYVRYVVYSLVITHNYIDYSDVFLFWDNWTSTTKGKFIIYNNIFNFNITRTILYYTKIIWNKCALKKYEKYVHFILIKMGNIYKISF